MSKRIKLNKEKKTEYLPNIRIAPTLKKQYYGALAYYNLGVTEHVTNAIQQLVRQHEKETRR